ncbi:hypothetical protein [Hymenobacter glacieicola]|uniref:Uncharacterized protein n=1 Tax=Hymenobacter glacieicola TaxID=1562124 RepID=A0ABQ1WKA1_9BACT|nr:hypothetical protein [Hymenobacter glacieicola]GGG34317.1 hypothetical protein GCM10011378_08420 [Hymenobacter glacieicola]
MRTLLLCLSCALWLASCSATRGVNPTVHVPKNPPHQLRYWFGKPPVASRTKKWGLSNRYNK